MEDEEEVGRVSHLDVDVSKVVAVWRQGRRVVVYFEHVQPIHVEFGHAEDAHYAVTAFKDNWRAVLQDRNSHIETI